jgi:hypothetical protein
MYDDSTQAPAAVPAGEGWQVSPEQVRAFAEAVAQVKADIDAVRREVEEFRDPALLPMLGTSPAGQLQTALANLQEFVDGAEKSAEKYREADAVSRDNMHE